MASLDQQPTSKQDYFDAAGEPGGLDQGHTWCTATPRTFPSVHC